MDFIDQLAQFCKNNLILSSVHTNDRGTPIIELDKIKHENDVALLEAPSSLMDTDLSRADTFDLRVQVLVQNASQKMAKDDSWLMFNILKQLPKQYGEAYKTITSADSTFELITMRGVTPPQKVDESEHGASLYSSLLSAELLIN